MASALGASMAFSSACRARPGRSRARFAGAVAAVAAAVVIAVSAAGLVAVMRGPQATATWTLRPDAGQGEWTGLEWHDSLPRRRPGRSAVVRRNAVARAESSSGGRLRSHGRRLQPVALERRADMEAGTGAPLFPGIVAIDGDCSSPAKPVLGRYLALAIDGRRYVTRVSVPFASRGGADRRRPCIVAAAFVADSDGLRDCPASTSHRRPYLAKATLPSDLAAARNVNVYPFIDGSWPSVRLRSKRIDDRHLGHKQ